MTIQRGWNPQGRGWDNLTVTEEEVNLFMDNQATGTDTLADTTGFVPATGGSTLTSSTTTAKEGTRSLKTVCGNASSAEGFWTTSVDITPNISNKLGVWVAGTGTVTVSLVERTAADAYINETASSTITLTETFQEVLVTRSFGATGAKARLKCVTPTKQAATIYADKLRVCKTSEW